MRVGFSGSRNLYLPDEWLVAAIIQRLNDTSRYSNVSEIVVGGCVGADATIAQYALDAGHTVHTIIPANISLVDPWVKTRCTTWEQMPSGTSYKDRNQAIVDRVDMLIAIPEDDEESSPRSGTWMTIRMGRRKGIPVEIYSLKLARSLHD